MASVDAPGDGGVREGAPPLDLIAATKSHCSVHGGIIVVHVRNANYYTYAKCPRVMTRGPLNPNRLFTKQLLDALEN